MAARTFRCTCVIANGNYRSDWIGAWQLTVGVVPDSFIDQVLQDSDSDMISLFVDHQGAIQLYSDPDLIDYATISKGDETKNTLERLLTDPADVQAVHEAMDELNSNNTRVTTRFVKFDGRRYLAGVAYIPEIDWYEITLLDLAALLPLSSFRGILLVYGITLFPPAK